jgi:hypothetical protein
MRLVQVLRHADSSQVLLVGIRQLITQLEAHIVRIRDGAAYAIQHHGQSASSSKMRFSTELKSLSSHGTNADANRKEHP